MNHGFYYKDALEEVGFLDETNYNFYAADGDIIMRLNQAGWKSVALELCFAEHLCHKPKIRNRGMLSPSHQKDMNTFKKKYPYRQENNFIIRKSS